jgi:hypothetical protein
MPVVAGLLIHCALTSGPGAGPAAAAPAATSAPAPADTLRGAPAMPSPIAVLAAFERAWLAGASDSVLACMSERSIELALHRAGPPGGHFPPSQAAYLLADLLHYGGTTEFRVVRFEWKEEEPPAAEIAWARGLAGEEIRERLAVQLALEDGVWRVVRVAAH